MSTLTLFFAWAPLSKLISLTTPASSAETTAPWTALNRSHRCQPWSPILLFQPMRLVTVVGGIVCGVLIIFADFAGIWCQKQKTPIASSKRYRDDETFFVAALAGTCNRTI